MPAAIFLGQRLAWRGRIYVVDGVDPMSVPAPHVHLRDTRTGKSLTVPVSDFDPWPLAQAQTEPAGRGEIPDVPARSGKTQSRSV